MFVCIIRGIDKRMSLQGTKGEEYIDAFPRFKKWINECICCHRKGYDPNMPENISVVEGNVGAKKIRQYFEPLSVNEYKLCEVCAKLVPTQAKKPDLKNIPKK